MTVAAAGFTLTSDEIAALSAAIEVDEIPGLPDADEIAEVSIEAGLRSLAARQLLGFDGDAVDLGPVLALLVGALTSVQRRLTLIDGSLPGELVTVSLAPGVMVVQSRTGVGTYDVLVLERAGADELLQGLLGRYDGIEAPGREEPSGDDEGALACLQLVSLDPEDTWMSELALWVRDDGLVLQIDAETGDLEPITGAGSLLREAALAS
jgi:hypothetical protein